VIAPHLAHHYIASRPERSVEMQRMWLPTLATALQAEASDVALTCGELGIADPNITTVQIGSEQLLVGLRPGHPYSDEASIELRRMGDRTLGMHSAHLFPAWHAGHKTRSRLRPTEQLRMLTKLPRVHQTAPRDPRQLPRVAQAEAVAQARSILRRDPGTPAARSWWATAADNQSETVVASTLSPTTGN
jgi:DNA-binding transcriptional LysR family regulator